MASYGHLENKKIKIPVKLLPPSHTVTLIDNNSEMNLRMNK